MGLSGPVLRALTLKHWISHRCGLSLGSNIFFSYYNYTSIQIYMKIIQAMGLEAMDAMV